MKFLHRSRFRSAKGFLCANRQTRCQPLACKQGGTGRIIDALPRSAALPLLGQNNRNFRIEIGLAQHRLAHHAGKQFEAFFERCRCRAGQVELIDGMCRAGFGIGVTAEGRAQPLPCRDCL